MTQKNAVIACPHCDSAFALNVGNVVLETPLICPSCKRTFFPYFVCPDFDSPARHAFAATRLYVDNAGKIYTFCPQHTYTTYAFSANEKLRRKHSPFHSAARYLDSLAFRLALFVANWRWRLVSRKR